MKIKKTCKQCNGQLNKNNKTFCNRSCAAAYNNKNSPKRTKNPNRFYNCLYCDSVFERQPHAIKRGHTKFCTVNCMSLHKKKLSKEKFNEGSLISRGTLRKALVREFGWLCSSCGLAEWLGKPITLWVDHIDGCATNNSPNNLRLMCPNCDTQGSTWGSKNKGKGRTSLGLHLWS